MATDLKNTLDAELENILTELIWKTYDIDRKIIYKLINLAKNNLNIIKDSYESLTKNKDINNEYLKIKIINEDCNLNFNDEQITLLKSNLLRIFIYLIDLFSDVLPLGTLVSLKKEYLNNLTGNTKINEANFVITKRFIFTDEAKVYFTYAGFLYPIANLGLKEDFYFTDNLIENVIYNGYSDDREITFVYMMKRELIIEKNYISIGYASKEEREKLIK